jgi:hypothetical protein
MVATVPSSRRRIGLRLLAGALTAIAVLALLELPAAFRLLHWRVVFQHLAGERAHYGTAYVYDADLSFRRIPNLTWSTRPLGDIEEKYGLPRAAARRQGVAPEHPQLLERAVPGHPETRERPFQPGGKPGRNRLGPSRTR